MADILIYGGVGLMIAGAVALLVIAITKGIQEAQAMITLPVLFVFLLADRRGRWAWAAIALGVVLMLIGLSLD